jgi:predicted PurR-regulated permease PerM
VAILDPRTTAVARTLAIFILIAAFIWGARDIIVAFIFAIFFAYVFEPLVSWLQERRKISGCSRGIAIAEVYLILGMACAAIALGAGPHIAAEGRELISSAPSLLDKLGSGRLVHEIGANRGWSYETQIRIEHFIRLHRTQILDFIQQAGIRAGELFAHVFWLALIPILAVFFLKEGKQMAESFLKGIVLAPKARLFLRSTLRDINDMAAHYIRAQLTLAALSTVAYTLVLGLAKVQYGIILGAFAGILEFIPIIGPLVGAVTVIAVAYLTGFHYIWLLVLFFGGWRVVQDYVNSPLLMHRSVKLHPLGVIFAVLAGGEIAGFIGVYLSIPLAAALQIFWRRWRLYYEESGLEPPSPARSEDREAA